MPPLTVLLDSWRFEPAAAAVMLVAAALYAAGIVRVRRAGGRWPLPRTLLFAVGGLGSYAAVSFGFLGVYSSELRFAFTTRIALLLFVVPGLMAAGRPLELLRRSLGPDGQRRLERALRLWVVRLFGNAIFATLFAASVFTIFLTPVAWVLRGSPALETVLGVAVPLVGLALVVPIAENAEGRTALFLTAEFLLAFAEMLIDAVPGIVLRIQGVVLDHAPVAPSVLTWWPSPLRDQQLSGDLLWFIAEIADVPILVLLMVRWMRSDRREATRFDELSDEEIAELTRQHLRDR